MISVVATKAGKDITYILSPYLSLKADARERFFPTVEEMLIERLKLVSEQYETLADFQKEAKITKLAYGLRKWGQLTIVGHVTVDLPDGTKLDVLYEESSGQIAKLHDTLYREE